MRRTLLLILTCVGALTACAGLSPEEIDARAAQLAAPLIATHNAEVPTRTLAPTPSAIPTRTPTRTPTATRTPSRTPRPTVTPLPTATATLLPPTRTTAPTRPPPTAAGPLTVEWSEAGKRCISQNQYSVTFSVRARGGSPPYTYYRDIDAIGGPISGDITYSLTYGEGSAAVGTFIVIDSQGQRSEIKFFVGALRC